MEGYLACGQTLSLLPKQRLELVIRNAAPLFLSTRPHSTEELFGQGSNLSFVLSRSCRFLQNDHQKSNEIKSTLETGNAGMAILQVMEALPEQLLHGLVTLSWLQSASKDPKG